MLTRMCGRLISIDQLRGSTLEVTVEIDGNKSRAIVYTELVGDVSVGDNLLLNTTAVARNLGSGGLHFVIANLSKPESCEELSVGHIVKARYTPCQHTVLSVEEDDSPQKKNIDNFTSLGSIPVVIGQLHSQLAPAAAAIKRVTHNRAKIAYIMTDSASLALGVSRLAHSLRLKNLIDSTITTGQAFGGEIEAVNIYTGLIAAKNVANADVIIVCPGPGNVGTGSKYGFSSIEMGETVNAINILGGNAIAIARISFADPRPRHQGLSHHTITALSEIALSKCTLVLPMIDQMKLMSIQEQIVRSPITYKHKIKIADGKSGIMELQLKGIEMKSMGRSFSEDEEFFLSASAAGAVAAEMLKSN